METMTKTPKIKQVECANQCGCYSVYKVWPDNSFTVVLDGCFHRKELPKYEDK